VAIDAIKDGLVPEILAQTGLNGTERLQVTKGDDFAHLVARYAIIRSEGLWGASFFEKLEFMRPYMQKAIADAAKDEKWKIFTTDQLQRAIVDHIIIRTSSSREDLNRVLSIDNLNDIADTFISSSLKIHTQLEGKEERAWSFRTGK